MADPPVIIAVNRNRELLAMQDAQALQRLGEAYARIYKRLEDKIELLVLDIDDRQPTRGEVVRMQRYKALMSQTADELGRFQSVLLEEILRSADINIPLGELQARQLISAAIVGDASIAGQFNVLPKAAIESILGFLSPDSPLYAKIQELAGFTANEVTNAIVEGVGLGYNPRKIAVQISNAYGQGLTNALRMTRTVQLYSYREASRASYIANGDVVEGWYWAARLDRSTCISCISQHGTWHPNTERLNDHHNGRCAMIPAVKGFPPPLSMQGEEWFNKQSEADQIKQMGRGAYDAYKAGKFTFADISTTHKDDIYGEMRVAKPLKELLRTGTSQTPLQFPSDISDEMRTIAQSAIDSVAVKYKGDLSNLRIEVINNPNENFVARANASGGRGITINKYAFDGYSAENDPNIRQIARTTNKIARLQARIDEGFYGDGAERQAAIDSMDVLKKNLGEIPPRFGVSTNPREVLVHEVGHIIQNDLTFDPVEGITDFLAPSELRRRGIAYETTLGARLDYIARTEGIKISEYAATNDSEYFAESFLAYTKNETAGIHPDLLDIFKRIMR